MYALRLKQSLRGLSRNSVARITDHNMHMTLAEELKIKPLWLHVNAFQGL